MLGVLSTKQRRRGGVLGALGATVPANCWDDPDFKTCNAEGWKIAERKCISEGLAAKDYGGDWQKCKQVLADDYAYFGCALRLCPPPPVVRPTTSGGWTWRNTTPNTSVKLFQDHLNVALTRDGYKQIVADGRLGPATCGAFAFVGGNYPELFKSDPIANIGVCQSFVNPTKVGSSTPEKMPISKEAIDLDDNYGGLPWMEADSRAPNLQRQLNRELDSNDYFPIKLTGMLDPPMCGAMSELDKIQGTRWMDTWGPYHDDCPSMVRPKKRAAPPPVIVAKPVPIAPVAPKPTVPLAPAASALAPAKSAMSLVGAGVLAALAVGGYVWWKKTSGGA
jgi:hypothetical protein